eukprot:778803-Alexandrium_andersonii.AAC.1
MSASLVGSEMCIRDRVCGVPARTVIDSRLRTRKLGLSAHVLDNRLQTRWHEGCDVLRLVRGLACL